MKRFLYTATVFIFAVSAQSQTDVDYHLLFQTSQWKTDQVLANIYNTVREQVSSNMDIRAMCDQATASIKAEWHAKREHLADSLGIQSSQAIDSRRNPNTDTAAISKFIELSKTIDQIYSPLISNAESKIRDDFNALLEKSFVDACIRYYKNSGRMTPDR